MWERDLTGVPRGSNWEGRVSRFRVDWLSNFSPSVGSEAEGLSLVGWYGPLAWAHNGPEDEGLIKKMVVAAGTLGSRWLGLYWKGILLSQEFTGSRAWLTQGGAVPPRSAKPPNSKQQITENRRYG